jgi:hypothetical protein
VLKLGVLEKKDYQNSKFGMLHPRSGTAMISLDIPSDLITLSMNVYNALLIATDGRCLLNGMFI